MAGRNNIVESAVQAVLDDIEKYSPEDFRKLNANPAKKAEILLAARKAAEEEVKHAEEFRGDSGEPRNVEERLAKYLPQGRIDMIKEGLNIPTYRLDIAKKSDGHYHVDITRGGKELMPSRVLITTADVASSTWVQYASIIVEGILLVIQAVGVKVEISDAVIAQTAEDIVPVVESSSLLQKAIQGVKDAWNGGSAYDKAKAIFYLIKDSNAAGILWKIIKSLCSNMSYWDWLKTAAIVTAQIVAAVATDGAALIAKIILALSAAYEFGKKIVNLVQLERIKTNLWDYHSELDNSIGLRSEFCTHCISFGIYSVGIHAYLIL